MTSKNDRYPPASAARARLAGLVARNADPEKIAAARAELVAAEVATWPPLTDEQREALRVLLS
jgi:hypothetical protein